MIRKMTIDDLPKIMILERSLFGSPWSEENYRFEILENPYANYVVEDEQGIRGYLGLWLNEDTLQITTLGVASSHQGKGLGSSLVKYALEYAISNKVLIMTLEVRVSNAKAIHLYERNGFEKVATRKQYYSHPDEDAILMMKTFEQM
jgi:ribosomal-protein-alanine N-acetyltransferase